MRIALIHNPRAGSRKYSEHDLIHKLRGAGHEVAAYPRGSKGLQRALSRGPDVVIASGGDGTVARVAIALCGSETPLCILPVGTSNNVAMGIGAASTTSQMLVDRLSSPQWKRLDVWRIAGGGHENSFVEAMGIGVIGTMIDEGHQWFRVLVSRIRGWVFRTVDHWTSTAGHVARLLRRQRPRWIDIRADAHDVSGEYVIAEAMNISAIGPRITLAPNADPGDGWLDLVLVTSAERDVLADYIESRADSSAIPLPPPRRVRRVELDWPNKARHVDDEEWPSGTTSGPRRVLVEIRGAINVLVP